MFNAAIQAKGLGIDEISVLEFGIYCGKALFFMEKHAKEITSITGVKFKIYGFDILNGLPSPTDYRDQEYFWPKGAFKNNETKMRRNIKESILVLGDVKNTAYSFIEEYNPPTIGFISFDIFNDPTSGWFGDIWYKGNSQYVFANPNKASPYW